MSDRRERTKVSQYDSTNWTQYGHTCTPRILICSDFIGIITIEESCLESKRFVLFDAVIWMGRLAQLVEHLVYTEGVKGSFPLVILTK